MTKKSNNSQTVKEKIIGNSKLNPIKEIIKKYQIDTKIWYVDSFKIKDGKWNTSGLKRDQDLKWTKENNSDGNPTQIMEGFSKRYPEFILAENKTYYIEITFKRIPIEIDIKKTIDSLIKKIPTFKYINSKPQFEPGSGTLLEISTLDAHFGKLAALIETGYRNYDVKIASEDYLYVTNKLLKWGSMFKPEKILMIIGQDLFHMDNLAGRTTGGDHTLDVDGRITKVNDKVFEVVLQSIYKCREVAPVEIIWSPGNHDHIMSYMLCFALSQHFKNDPFVTIDIEKTTRKARLWGNLLVGFTHRIVGKHNTWANELAQEFPELWGKSKFREWHHGDQHKKQDVKTTPTYTSGGVIMRQLTALSPVDKWHFENVFTDAVPGGEAFLWSKDHGVFANFIAWTGQYEGNRNKLIKK